VAQPLDRGVALPEACAARALVDGQRIETEAIEPRRYRCVFAKVGAGLIEQQDRGAPGLGSRAGIGAYPHAVERGQFRGCGRRRRTGGKRGK
jgi:hypothetical protein